ncbi:tRNA (adenosine(37)-N6)-threonylcarbamoyltransferase complex dimerization subunit type 1 TsaB [Aestuariibacter halophilus]|uniref:tRNA threonylcarbamoyladenosine biosynthesis protein TsaB n=1 Tax=Fluctibacter halophilus TaxID=226011 RepID=A0ABS8G6Z5_9ALTE|nr:tRNA (adenosine(37)-N6)-threonylcarbamoyltransferase complex dimerization subunit type 1 TsaB [Aestuariibacter halophilus]MCC2616264.1 tRNA (adenosine(37)-N6)-threonylcarbamoyltransferase complex dimerization subunit type 1 TsaB [Aestuariibacter halophilus]
MKLLAIDTATEACSVALHYDDQVSGAFALTPQQHSQRLLPMVESVLSEAGVTLAELDGLAFGRGPGSFTGVRIATGMIQGLALGTGLPVAGVSTLSAMAQQVYSQTGAQRVAVAIDARMDEVYFGQFECNDGVMTLVGEEAVLPPDMALQQLQDVTVAKAGTGWAAYPVLAELGGVSDVLYPDARYMLPFANAALAAGQGAMARDIQPVYLRDKVTWKKLPGRE